MSREAPARVMIVEDSTVVRQLLAHIVARDPRLVLAAAVGSAEEALRELPRVQPDVISMDIRLPGMDGLEATRRIMAERPTPIVVIADAIEDSRLHISMQALRAGALSVVEKPVGLASRDYEAIADTIRTQLAIMSRVPVIRRRHLAGTAPASRPVPAPPIPAARPSLVAVAASTGGPPALARLLGALPAEFPLPVLLVQHMGASFMAGFADWLNGVVPLRVRLAEEGMVPRPGHVLVAPGDRHLSLTRAGALHIDQEGPVGGQRPAATVLFRSVAEALGASGVGVVLTGMGEDGASGLLALRRAGGLTIAEDESSAVVYGMPAAAVRLGAAGLSLPLEAIAPCLLRHARMEVA
ncbi:chemotaxis-specific protein-glutamate methyltransferase CheB [Roseomonas sp. OT10]|uniref:chemotaxis-specific protein-glutamate methyltransferase CheB n=1 Tax=Roseomonas cutis TaxID=2897332 RepID=UPI001E5868DD|nr:chemotaxis-specific protein-glutamate methyltransferase CheB [Roseomonas sp. OT10]UFN48095.1 chemotaxis-specific protein-glutamate methyltransferase CheB [Roseomonas sp. OT10]